MCALVNAARHSAAPQTSALSNKVVQKTSWCPRGPPFRTPNARTCTAYWYTGKEEEGIGKLAHRDAESPSWRLVRKDAQKCRFDWDSKINGRRCSSVPSQRLSQSTSHGGAVMTEMVTIWAASHRLLQGNRCPLLPSSASCSFT